MPLIKTYLVVTNNALEMPVKVDIRGVKEAASYLGISTQAARNRLQRDSWGKLPYKILIDESAEPMAVDKRAYDKWYRMTHDRSDRDREYYQKNKERIMERNRVYRERKKVEKQEEKNEIKRD